MTTSAGHCTAFADGQQTSSPAFIFAGSICYALGNTSQRKVSALDPANASAGVAVYFGGGAAGWGCAGPRGARFELVCDPTATVRS